MTKLEKFLNYIKNPRFSRMLLSLMHNGYLKEIGWFYTYFSKQPVDESGHPIPWATYSYIAFIRTFLTKEMTLFEYGSGNSTLFYAKLTKKVYGVENNLEWYRKVTTGCPANVSLVLHDKEDHQYICPKLLQTNRFDVIIVDGRRRVECIKASLPYLKDTGILILDDSERDYYYEGMTYLAEKGYKRIDFWGIAPMYFHNKCTTLFYKNL